jgi:hypothetical protein
MCRMREREREKTGIEYIKMITSLRMRCDCMQARYLHHTPGRHPYLLALAHSRKRHTQLVTSHPPYQAEELSALALSSASPPHTRNSRGKRWEVGTVCLPDMVVGHVPFELRKPGWPLRSNNEKQLEFAKPSIHLQAQDSSQAVQGHTPLMYHVRCKSLTPISDKCFRV